MKLIRIAAAVLNQTPLDWDGNQARILGALDEARASGASIVCLPEMCISGYGCEDTFASRYVTETSMEVLQALLPATAGLIVSFGLPILHRNALFNTACLAVDGQARAFVAKRSLAGEGIHYEPRWFKPWPEGARSYVSVGDQRVPLGDQIVSCSGVKIAFEICQDAWTAFRPAAELAARGVDVILNPSASHFAFNKLEVRKRLVLEGSRAYGVTYAYANLLGNEAGRAIYDGGALIASQGRLLSAGKRFSFADYVVTSAVIDVDATRMEQARHANFSPELMDGDEGLVEVDFDFPPLEPVKCEPTWPAWELDNHLKEEEFCRAVSLALFDYLRKSRAQGFVVSLSGGVDSSAVSCLVALMVRLGVAELGKRGFIEKLPGCERFSDHSTGKELVAGLLTCVYQATTNSSDSTKNAAQTLAQGLGASYFYLDVDPVVQRVLGMVENELGRKLTWEHDDVALQNVQARVRAPSVWMFANLQDALLLATSNRSEAAVGYATMDGDTCGGLSPIAGIDKAYLRQWMKWLESEGPEEMGPIFSLAAVNAQEPTAELRPPAEHQTDEHDLMPYDLLDAIERAAIRDKQSPLEVFHLIRTEFDYQPVQLAAWIERFFRLWSRNQWKRERYAPSFHLDDENLDPKTWCRFPILSGGFERELAELQQAVQDSYKSQSWNVIDN